MVKPVVLFSAAALAVLTACSPAVTGSPVTTSPSSRESPVVSKSPFQSTPPLPTGTPVQLPAERFRTIQNILTERGAKASDITVVTAEAVTWPDGSWGCPQPGMLYTQAIEEGMHVVVAAQGKNWDFRFGKSETPLICEQQSPEALMTPVG